MKLQKENILIGIWSGKIPETSAELLFSLDNSGSIVYPDLKKSFIFKYHIEQDSVLVIANGKNLSKHYFKIKKSKLRLRPLKVNEETIDIINEFEFRKKE